ncbi:MAG: SMP-30/gluconolactonase/LRE family protein [Nocardioidaceae bacterium]
MNRSQTAVAPITVVAGAPRSELGESPCWDPRTNRLLWVDILAGLVHTITVEGTTRTFKIGQPVSAVVADGDGWLLAVETGIQRCDRDLSLVGAVDLLPRPTLVRMNDAARDSRGRLWVGTLAYDERPGAGTLFRVDPDDSAHSMVTGLGISNGIAWSADERRMYHVDSLARIIWAREYDVATGEIGAPTAWYRPGDRAGVPDGIALDADGCLWVALWGGAAVVRLDPEGRVIDEIAVPALQVSSVAFGGEGLRTLFVTTASEGLDEAALARYPASGELFSVPVSVPGASLGAS